MADPISIGASAAIGLGSTVLGSFLGAKGAEDTAGAQAQMFQYKAGMALMNQRINKQNAQFARDAGDINAEEAGLKDAQNIAETKVKQSASGLDVNTGSNATTRESQAYAAKFDQDAIHFDAAKTAYGYEAKAAGDEAEANLDMFAASNAKTAGDINAMSSILGGVSSVATKWSQASTSGLFSSKPGPIGTFDPENWGAAPTWT